MRENSGASRTETDSLLLNYVDPKKFQIVSALVRSGFYTMRVIAGGVQGRRRVALDDLRKARRFLFLEYSPALGSNVHATPVFEALKKAVPDAKTMVACGHMAFEVFRYNPFIDYLVETPRPPVSTLQAFRTLREHLRVTGFVPEIVITSKANEQRSIATLAFLAGRAMRLGYTLAPQLYDVALEADSQRSLIANNLDVIQRLGYGKDSPEPRVGFSAEDLEHAGSLIGDAEPGRPRVAFISQTSPSQRKSWPADRFIAVANHVTTDLGACAVFLGTASEQPPIENIRAQIRGESVSLAGRTTIAQVAAVLSLCDYAVTLDTGNMHIGRSAGLPMVILAPAWQPVIEWLPLGFDQYRIFKGDDIPKAPPDYVMDEMSVEEVIAGLDDLFARYPASPESRKRRVERGLARVSPLSRRSMKRT